MKKRMQQSVLSLLCLALACAVGCGAPKTAETPPYTLRNSPGESGTVAENDRYALQFDGERAGVILLDKATGNRFGTTPAAAQETLLDEFGMPIKNQPKVDSPLLLDYIESATGTVTSALSYTDSVLAGNYAVEPLTDGVRVTYCFDKAEIAIPVEYTLSERGLTIAIDPNEIEEGENPLYRLSVAPMLCSISNDSPDGYLFVPSGSGGLIYPRNTESAVGLTYEAEFYGDDPMISPRYQTQLTLRQACRLPVFGAAEGNTAICAVVEQGAEAALVSAQTGVRRLGYTSVCAVWRLRSYQNIIQRVGLATPTERQYYAADKTTHPLRITYTPLSGEAAGYDGMARCYRDYLRDNGMQPTAEKNRILSLQLLGAVRVQETFLGIPYRKLLPVTTLSQATQIVSQIAEQVGQPFDVLLTGFGGSGISPGKTSANRLAGKLGGAKQARALSDAVAALGGRLYLDYEVVTDTSSGGSALAADGNRLKLYGLNIWSRMKDSAAISYYLNRRADLPGYVEQATANATKLGLSGISLDTLSTTAYSDYSDPRTYSKGAAAEDFAAMAASCRAAGLRLATGEANAYAAALADHIFGAPMQADASDLIAEEVPFYQLVFRDTARLSTPAVNAASDPQRMVLKAAETGVGLGYTLYNTFDKRLFFLEETAFFGGEYASVRDALAQTVTEYAPCFAAVGDAAIVKNEVLQKDVHRTVFANGTAVYVNYSDADFASPAGTVPAKSYRFGAEVTE